MKSFSRDVHRDFYFYSTQFFILNEYIYTPIIKRYGFGINMNFIIITLRFRYQDVAPQMTMHILSTSPPIMFLWCHHDKNVPSVQPGNLLFALLLVLNDIKLCFMCVMRCVLYVSQVYVHHQGSSKLAGNLKFISN